MDEAIISDAAGFKAVVEQHKAEGWRNLSVDRKVFICTYIRSGYSTVPMVEDGCSQEEADRYLRDPLVQAAIADVSEAYAAINTFSTAGWRAKLARALDMALGETPRTIVTSTGAITIAAPDLATAARLLDLAARYKDIRPEAPPADFERFPALPWQKRGNDG